MSKTKWLICIMAAIGFAFDIYELLMLPLIVRPALLELVGAAPGTPQFQMWVGRLFYIPALAGGVFGLLGSYLADRLGRRRVLTWAIFIYAGSAFIAGYSTSIEMLIFFRSTKFIGVCVEFVAAVAWLAELFEDPKQREKVLGYTQAFSSLGGLMVAWANSWLVNHAGSLPAIAIPDWLGGANFKLTEPHAAWRYTFMSGIIPAIPLMIIRPFLPESPVWQRKKAEGTMKRPSLLSLFDGELARTTIVTTLMFACSYGAAFGAIQHIPQIVPGLPEVQAAVNGKPVPEKKRIEQATAANVTKVQEYGGLLGRILLAVLAVRIVSRRTLFRIFQLPGLILMPIVFAWASIHSLTWLNYTIFLLGLCTVAQFSFWGNYLPRVYPLHLRGTGEGFAANVGGRMIGTSMAWVTSSLAAQTWIPGSPTMRVAYSAAMVGGAVYLVGLIACFFLPEPSEGALPE
jgi:MFS family permease